VQVNILHRACAAVGFDAYLAQVEKRESDDDYNDIDDRDELEDEEKDEDGSGDDERRNQQ